MKNRFAAHPMAQHISMMSNVLFSLLFLWGTHATARLLPDEQNNVDIYRKCSPSVVNITSITLSQNFFFDVIPQTGQGSGAIIRAEGYILTNNHVVGNAQKVEVTLNDKSTFPAHVVGNDPDSDIAILRIMAKNKALTPLEFGEPDSLSVGQKVLAIGNPFGLGGSLSVGVISSLGRDIRTPSDRLVKDVIQTDAAINPGNSGGPLLDSSGKLIGINTQIVSRSGGNEGIGFAISIKTVKKIIDQLIRYGRVLRPELGIIEGVGMPATFLAQLDIKIPTEQGVMITEMVEGSPADNVGLHPATQELVWGFRRIPANGDVIFQLDDTRVTTMRDILDYINDKKTGDSVTVHFARGKVKKTVSVKLSLPTELKRRSL